MPKILISYRRSDTAGVAGRIFDRLVARYGHDSIFMDVDHIPFGIDFRDHIRETLLAGDMLLAIVGTRWLGPRPEGASRMHDDNDPVRVEIETALVQGVPLIPVLVDGATMPSPEDLPAALSRFSYLNAAPVDTGRDFHQHMDRLIRTIDRVLEAKGAVAQKAPAAEPPVAAARPQTKWFAIGGSAAAILALVAGLALWVTPSSRTGDTPAGKTVSPSSELPIKLDGPVRIGMGLVRSGSALQVGNSILLAMKIWQEDVNARGGLLGSPVELIVHDDEGRVSNVAGIYARLFDIDKADLVVSGWGTPLITEGLQAASARNKLFMGLLASGVNEDANYPRYFSMMPSGPPRRPTLSGAFFDVVASQNPRPQTLAISSADDRACANINVGARVLSKNLGLRVVYDDTFSFYMKDMAPAIRAVQAADPDIVFTCMFTADTVAYVKAVANLGFKPKMIGGVMPSLRTPAVKAELGPLLNGWVNYEFWLPAPNMMFPGVGELMRKYQERAREAMAEPIGYQVAPWTYARMQVLQQAVEATRSLDDNRLADYIRLNTFKTVVGDVRFGERGEWMDGRVLEVQFQNIKGHDIEQFRGVDKQVVVGPAPYKSGNLIYPFANARP